MKTLELQDDEFPTAEKNCIIAAILYLVTLVLSFGCCFADIYNSKQSKFREDNVAPTHYHRLAADVNEDQSSSKSNSLLSR